MGNCVCLTEDKKNEKRNCMITAKIDPIHNISYEFPNNDIFPSYTAQITPNNTNTIISCNYNCNNSLPININTDTSESESITEDISYDLSFTNHHLIVLAKQMNQDRLVFVNDYSNTSESNKQ
mmetsp:Transcript_38613/g.47849  ORF Transcript_38613/g.47849 Transcript_38613/m.47849 type:complete len:123 (-) Transcript_38613:106-474(-)